MRNKSYSEIVAQGCLIMLMVMGLAQCAFGQELNAMYGVNSLYLSANCDSVILGPRNNNALRWNNSGYFKSSEYVMKRKRALDFSDMPETWDGVTVATWVAYAISGIAHGAGEAYHADPTVFEKRFGASDRSFWGSEAWVRNYEGNDPANPHKHEFFGNVGRDFWHTANIADFVPAVSCSFIIGARKQPMKYRVINLLIGVGARTLFSTVTYASLRQ